MFHKNGEQGVVNGERNTAHRSPLTAHHLIPGAIFVADAHFNTNRPQVLALLEKIEQGRIQTPQLFLMGDIFDLLIGVFDYTSMVNREAVEKINTLAQTTQVFYLEGNHDFLLQSLFPGVRVIGLEKQPFVVEYGGKKIALAHGDLFVGAKYALYAWLIRQRAFLKFLNLVSFNFVSNWLLKREFSKLSEKKLCHSLDGFEDLVAKRIGRFGAVDAVIEGHFHQNIRQQFNDVFYVNLPSLACTRSVLVFRPQGAQIAFEEIVF